jgi:DNA-binding beta-propeller fold protein YncE
LALDVDADGTCYVADTGNNAVRRVTPDGEVTTVAGAPPGGDADGAGVGVGLRWPTGIAAGHEGHLWVADYGNGAIRLIERTGLSTTTLRLEGRRWPVAVALAPDGEVVVVAELIDAERRSQTCVTSAGAER